MSGRRSALAVIAPNRLLSLGGVQLGPGGVFVANPDVVAGLVERGVCLPLAEPTPSTSASAERRPRSAG